MGPNSVLVMIRLNENNQEIHSHTAESPQIPQKGEIVEVGDVDNRGEMLQKSAYQVVERAFAYYTKPDSESVSKVELFVEPL